MSDLCCDASNQPGQGPDSESTLHYSRGVYLMVTTFKQCMVFRKPLTTFKWCGKGVKLGPELHHLRRWCNSLR